MSTFKEIKGQLIKSLSSDPSPVSVGDIWYNSTSKTLKCRITTAGAWASGTSMNIARRVGGGAGTQSLALVFAGAGGPPTKLSSSEEWNGSGWTGGGTMGTARYFLGSCGTQTAALGFAGYNGGNKFEVEEYDGSSWSEVNNIPYSVRDLKGFGIQTAAVAAGGYSGSAVISTTANYDGTKWTRS